MAPALRWVLVGVCVLAIVCLLGYARGEPGDDDRAPDPASALDGG